MQTNSMMSLLEPTLAMLELANLKPTTRDAHAMGVYVYIVPPVRGRRIIRLFFNPVCLIGHMQL